MRICSRGLGGGEDTRRARARVKTETETRILEINTTNAEIEWYARNLISTDRTLSKDTTKKKHEGATGRKKEGMYA